MDLSRLWKVLFGLILVSCVVLVGMYVLILALLPRSSPVQPSILPSAIVIDFHYPEMASQLASMTELQRSDYLQRLAGTHYRVTGTVTEVLSTGQVNVKADGCPSICVLLQAPSSVGLSWQRGQAIRFVGVATWQSAYFNSLLLHLNFERLD